MTLSEASVKKAIREGGSIQQAAKILGKSYNSLYLWIARNGYEVKKTAELVKRCK